MGLIARLAARADAWCRSSSPSPSSSISSTANWRPAATYQDVLPLVAHPRRPRLSRPAHFDGRRERSSVLADPDRRPRSNDTAGARIPAVAAARPPSRADLRPGNDRARTTRTMLAGQFVRLLQQRSRRIREPAWATSNCLATTTVACCWRSSTIPLRSSRTFGFTSSSPSAPPRQPDAIAVTDGSDSLSYASLDARANQLAHALQRAGIGAGDVVGLCMDRSVDMVVGLLGILKAGGAYLPLNHEHPAARLQHQLVGVGRPRARVAGGPATTDCRSSATRSCASIATEPSSMLLERQSTRNRRAAPTTSSTSSTRPGRPGRRRVSRSRTGNLSNYTQDMVRRLGARARAYVFGMVTAISTDLGNTAVLPRALLGRYAGPRQTGGRRRSCGVRAPGRRLAARRAQDHAVASERVAQGKRRSRPAPALADPRRRAARLESRRSSPGPVRLPDPQPLRPDRDDCRVMHDARRGRPPSVRPGNGPDRPADLEHALLRAGRPAPAGAAGCPRTSLHRGRRRCPRVHRAAGPDGGAFPRPTRSRRPAHGSTTPATSPAGYPTGRSSSSAGPTSR